MEVKRAETKSVADKTTVYDYKDVIFNPCSEDAKTAIGKSCFFSLSPRDVIDIANKCKNEARILTGIKDGYFVDEDGTKWDCIIVSRDEPRLKYVPFKTPSQFISAYKCHRGEDLGKALGCQLASLGGM